MKRVVTNSGYEIGRSRIYDALSSREERSLAGWFILSVVALILVALEVTGGADAIRSVL